MRAWYRGWQIASQVTFALVFGIRSFGRENVPRRGPVLLVSNHQSYLDPVLCGIGLTRELDYIARESLFHNPAFAWYIRSLNAFPIQRGQADLAAIRKIVERLSQGRAVTLFPEATRTPTGHIRPIKSGFELVARKGKATVVPVVIDGAFEAWPRTRPLPGPGRIGILYGEPIPPQVHQAMKRNELVDIVNDRLRTMQAQLRRLMGRPPFIYSQNALETENR
jgi:1-acyl-sn-glycerol-3-phosphate acyltransferase